MKSEKLVQILRDCEDHYSGNTVYDYNRGKLLEQLAQLDKRDFDRLCSDLTKLLLNAKGLLSEFWYENLELCPIETSTDRIAEEKRFEKFVDGRYYFIL